MQVPVSHASSPSRRRPPSKRLEDVWQRKADVPGAGVDGTSDLNIAEFRAEPAGVSFSGSHCWYATRSAAIDRRSDLRGRERAVRRGQAGKTLAQPEVRHLIPRASRAPVIVAIHKNHHMALQRMDNVGIVVESLDVAISFFAELGLELEGRAMIEGDWSGRVTGLRDQRVEIAIMRTPDRHGRLELSRFLAPPVVADHRNAPVNALGYLRVMFAVDDLDDTLVRLRRLGAELVGEVVQYEGVYRLCYVRGPEGILIGLAEQIG